MDPEVPGIPLRRSLETREGVVDPPDSAQRERQIALRFGAPRFETYRAFEDANRLRRAVAAPERFAEGSGLGRGNRPLQELLVGGIDFRGESTPLSVTATPRASKARNARLSGSARNQLIGNRKLNTPVADSSPDGASARGPGHASGTYWKRIRVNC